MSHTKWQWVGHLLCIWKPGKEVAFTILINLNNGRVYISWSFIRQILSCGPNDRVIMESVYISRSVIMHIFSCAPYDRVIMESVYISRCIITQIFSCGPYDRVIMESCVHVTLKKTRIFLFHHKKNLFDLA